MGVEFHDTPRESEDALEEFVRERLAALKV
jgi:hypothetical protein